MNYLELKNKTPLYIYDINKLDNRIKYLRSKFDKDIKLVYAVKANTFIVKEIENIIDKYEICSYGEYEICDKLNINYDKMVISGVNKEKKYLSKMIKNNINRFTIESKEHYKMLSSLAKKYNKKINVLIRLTSGNQFGVSEKDFKYIIKNNKLLNIVGIEYFSGTQKHSIKRINKEIEYINDFVNDIYKEYNVSLNEIEYGVGLPVFYFQGDEFDEDSFLSEVNESLKLFKGKNVLLEIGRSMVACSGEYITKVVDKKSNQNGNFLIVDGGINHLVYFGGTLAMKTPYYDVLPKRENKKIVNYNVYGSLCTTNDILMKNIDTNEIKLGDMFVFKNVGAYSSTEGISLFLSRELPRIALLNRNNELVYIRDNFKTSKLNCPYIKRK